MKIKMKFKVAAALAAGVLGAGLITAPAQASWNQLSPGRIGFWTSSYGDPYQNGEFGGYRHPDNGGYWGYVLPSWLDYPNSLWNRTPYTAYMYENPSCRSDGGRWVRAVAPGQRINTTPGTDWDSIQAFSYLAPTPSRRSCR